MKMGGEFDSNVFSLGANKMAQNFPAITQVDAYWEALRDGRLMPNRSEVDPRGLKSALEFAIMLELVAPGVARIRVAGMHMTDLLGMEVRGMPLTAFFEPGSRSQISETLDRVVNGPRVAELKLTSPSGLGKPSLEARLFLAPLANEGRCKPRILACLQSKGTIGRTPRRFAVSDVHSRRIVATAEPAEVTLFEEPKAIYERFQLAESPKAFDRPSPSPQPRQKGDRSHLRLVKND